MQDCDTGNNFFRFLILPGGQLRWRQLPKQDPWTGVGCLTPEPEVGIRHSWVTELALKNKIMKKLKLIYKHHLLLQQSIFFTFVQ
jgi:hypothetical protein